MNSSGFRARITSGLPKYLVTGATGDIGSKVVELLLRKGERPGVFVRDAGKARSRFGDSVDIFVGDLTNPDSLRVALEGVDELFRQYRP